MARNLRPKPLGSFQRSSSSLLEPVMNLKQATNNPGLFSARPGDEFSCVRGFQIGIKCEELGSAQEPTFSISADFFRHTRPDAMVAPSKAESLGPNCVCLSRTVR